MAAFRDRSVFADTAIRRVETVLGGRTEVVPEGSAFVVTVDEPAFLQ